MNKSIITTIIAITILAGMSFTSADAAIITPNTPASGDGGLVNNFNDGNTAPSPFGYQEAGGAGSVSGGVLTLVDNADFIDWEATTDLATSTQAQVGDGTTKDWVMQMDVENTVFGNNSRLLDANHGPHGANPIFRIRADSALNGYLFRAAVDTSFSTSPGSHTWLFHYKTATDRVDFYVDQQLVLGDVVPFTTATGMFADSRWGGANNGGTWLIDNVIITTEFDSLVVPEPSSLTLIGIGALILRGFGRKKIRG